MPNAPHLLIVGNGGDLPPRIKEIRPDVRTTILVRLDKARKVRSPQNHTRIVALDPTQPDEWVAVAKDIHARDPFDYVGSFAEKDQDKLAPVAEAIGLPAHTRDTVRWVWDKAAMRDRLAAAGVGTATAQRVETIDSAYDFAKRFGYPIVVKPVFGVASSGVSIVRTADDLPAAWAWGMAAKEPDRPELMVEEYLDGPELSVEAFSCAGEHFVVALTEKYKEPEHCVELGHAVRGPFSPETVSRVSSYVRDVLDALGVRNGPTHTELIITQAGPRVVETHLRAGGDEIPEMLSDTYGIDFGELLIRQTLGEDVRAMLTAGLERMASSDVYPAIWYGVPNAAGRVVAVDGLADARRADGVVWAELQLDVGDELPADTTDSRSRAVAVRATAGSPADAIAAARAATELIRFTVQPPYAFRDLHARR